MEIIEVTHEKQVLEPHITYCGENAVQASNSFQEKFGIMPDTVYQKVGTHGRVTTYVPAPASVMNKFYSGAFYDRTDPPS